MNIADFRLQTGVPTLPSAGAVGVYANASGTLIAQTSAGNRFYIGGQLTGTVVPGPNIAVLTGTLLGGSPIAFIPFVGPTGQKLAVLAYAYTGAF